MPYQLHCSPAPPLLELLLELELDDELLLLDDELEELDDELLLEEELLLELDEELLEDELLDDELELLPFEQTAPLTSGTGAGIPCIPLIPCTPNLTD